MVLIGIALATALLLVVLHWWSEGIFEASDAVLLVVIFGGLIVGLFGARTPGQFVLAFVPLAAGGAYLAYSYYSGGMRPYLRQKCRECMSAIEFDPRNLGAREYLAEALYNLGELDRAIDEMQVAVNMGAGMECQYRLNKWLRERQLRDTANPVCRWCNTENQAGARKCSRCGSDLPYQTALTRWLTGGRTGRARYYLLLFAGVALVGMSLLLLPLHYAFIPVLLCITALAGWALLGGSSGS